MQLLKHSQFYSDSLFRVRICTIVFVGCCCLGTTLIAQQSSFVLRPPAVPLVVHDPYFSIWSPHDRLSDGDTIHWTEKPHRLTALVRIDGKTYRLMGGEPHQLPALPQTGLQLTATRTIYTFQHESVNVSLSFITPALPENLDVLARPLTYLDVSFEATDENSPSIQLYVDADAELAVNTRDQPVKSEIIPVDGIDVLRVGTLEQAVLARQGDDTRIDWGYFYLAAEKTNQSLGTIGYREFFVQDFASTGSIARSNVAFKRATAEAAGVLALHWDLGKVTNQGTTCSAMLAYDDLKSIRYFDSDLQPYWRRNGMDAIQLLRQAAKERDALTVMCRRFDEAMERDTLIIGDREYAQLISLCHRQSLAGTKLVADASGMPLFFTKENNSNGCLGTVDVFYPQSPHLLLLSPSLMKATLVPILEYAKSSRWKFDFAPHDLGRYPHATGQVYGGGERTLDRQMMVEESANMLLLVAALAHAEGSADFATPYFESLDKWAKYLAENGYDPANQLCTDDFAGHLARNVNLSAKAICGLGAYAQLLERAGKNEASRSYRAIATEMAKRWSKDADDQGTHTRLGFGLPGTWSQKYNLAWDIVLGMNLFGDEVYEKEIKHYRSVNQAYGLPLDSRSNYTKLDWIVWTATLAKDRTDFHSLIDPLIRFANETPDRTPLTDWYFADSGKRRGFKARPVVGGVFMPMLKDPSMWQAWSKQGEKVNGTWAPLPIRPVKPFVATGEDQPAIWSANWNRPTAENWNLVGFAPPAKIWSSAEFPIGIESDAGTPIRSNWKEREVWGRREFTLDSLPSGEVCVRLTHSGPVEIWINGVLAVDRDGSVRGYQVLPVSSQAAQALKIGSNMLSVHMQCNTPKPQKRDMIDVGLLDREPLRN